MPRIDIDGAVRATIAALGRPTLGWAQRDALFGRLGDLVADIDGRHVRITAETPALREQARRILDEHGVEADPMRLAG